MSYKLNLSELKAASSFTTSDNLRTDANNSKKMSNSIDEFCRTSELQGESWQSVFASLQSYSSVLNERISLAQELAEVISRVLNNLISYMGDYDEIDASKEAEIRASIDECNDLIATITKSINARDPIYEAVIDENGVITGYRDTGRTKPRYDADKINAWNEQIKGLQAKIDNELQPYLNKIIGLTEVYEEAARQLSEAFSKIDNFKKLVDNLQVHSVMV